MLQKRLRELRKSKKMNQNDIAKHLGISLSGYASYEQGVANPSIDTLLKLAELFEVSTDYLLGKTDLRYTQDELNFYHEVKTKGIDDLVKEYNISLGDESMSERDEKILIKLIKSFLNDVEKGD